MDVISESEFSDFIRTGERSLCLASSTRFVGLSISFSLSVLDLVLLLLLVLWPYGPQTSKTLLNP
jgi:hypothetical protein